MNTPLRVVLVDDHSVVRRGLRSYLDSFTDIEIVGEASNGEEAVDNMEYWLPDIVVVDMLMPGGMDGVETTRKLVTMLPNIKVVVLTAHMDEARVVAALRAGATGYVKKDAEPELLLSAVRAAAKGQSVLDPSIAGSVLQELVGATGVKTELTDREMQVLRLLAHGQTNREIADSLVVSGETVKTHVGNVLAKLQMAHRTQAVVAALKQGIITLEDIELP